MAKAEEASNNLERVTDYVEERELDASKMAQAMSGLESAADGGAKEELPAIKPNKEFVAYIVTHLEVAEKEAKAALRRHENDLQRSLESLMTC
mmetsp:Transcript_25396/g.79573  ORF Transcript_25396/g.79573 Transcript_25396/m.79573 type:complete len:93 (+) Transcript_25396:182-460(+)|eukprot:CAMPEP_0118867894 /NCGR_PEP_ID=MMETSP1163-20130328/11354_1 /TAXON_ID=124430 /ORGANISM="Phaeomonas parva, Strain CCMP2877" /LENGTH=92 /DNA_ID=CAMNT_0006802383 /DNA_START=147 /DNA_END=425 /DNA_ORIENTATION=+